MTRQYTGARRPTALPGTLALSLTALLVGCFDGSSSSSRSLTETGTFVDSPVAGLNYQGTSSEASLTDEAGQFCYERGENLTFSIGALELGSAEGAAILTPLDITSGAGSAD